MLSLEGFKQRATVIIGAEAHRIRDRYIDRFVDTASDWYKDRIATRKRYRDGEYYSGYLWETLKHDRVIPEAEILDRPDLADETVYVLWDLHRDELQVLEDYWRFPREAVLELAYRDLMAGLEYLPEDIYIFDRDYAWSLILTHESWEAHDGWEANPHLCLEAS